MSLLNKLFNFVVLTTKKYNIDYSHSISHSMEVLHFASNIYQNEKFNNSSFQYCNDKGLVRPFSLEKYERIIYVSSILHDMCDKKYMSEKDGIVNIEEFLQEKIPKEEIDITNKIVSTMSYSKVKKYGFPDLQDSQLAYHIVRESDLLCAYNFNRAMIYNMYKFNGNIDTAFTDSENLFQNRVFKHNDHNLFITDYSKKQSLILQEHSLKQINTWRQLVKNPIF